MSSTGFLTSWSDPLGVPKDQFVLLKMNYHNNKIKNKFCFHFELDTALNL